MTPLYMYDPMKYLKNSQSYRDIIWSDVGAESKIYGSFAQSLDHLTISEWTAITYAVSVGFLLVLVVAARWFTLNQIQPTSKFPLVDFAVLKKSVQVINRQADGTELDIGMPYIFEGCEAGHDNQILRAITAVKLRPG